jgi:hypothetical protein
VEPDSVIEWQARNLSALKRLPFKPPCSLDVTLMTAWLWRDDRFDTLLDSLLSAILMAWRYCGRLPVVLLVNRETPALLNMAQEWGLRLQVEPHIKGGGGNARELNRDVILNSTQWFDTEYLLSFQNHAFPIREGLEDYLGKYDCIGAPWVFDKDDWITRLLLRHRGDVGNGAFALRSRKLYETIAWYYRRKYKYIPHCYLVIDDYFIGKTLPSFERRYRETMRIAPPEVAAAFSLEDNIALHKSLHAQPFGFHGPSAFRHLISEGQIRDVVEL